MNERKSSKGYTILKVGAGLALAGLLVYSGSKMGYMKDKAEEEINKLEQKSVASACMMLDNRPDYECRFIGEIESPADTDSIDNKVEKEKVDPTAPKKIDNNPYQAPEKKEEKAEEAYSANGGVATNTAPAKPAPAAGAYDGGPQNHEQLKTLQQLLDVLNKSNQQ